MKKIFLAFILFAGISSAAYSVPLKDGRNGNRGCRTTRELNLTNDQKNKLESIRKQYKTELDKLNADTTISKEIKREKLKQLSDSRRSEIQAFLTPEQTTLFNDLTKNRKHFSRNNHRNSSQRRISNDRSIRSLNLNDDQKNKLKDADVSLRNDLMLLRSDTSLTKEERMIKRSAIKDSYQKEIQSLLTPEQLSKCNENKVNRKSSGKSKVRVSGKRHRNRLDFDASTIAKLDTLKYNHSKQKQSVELSRIAPDAPKAKIKDLRKKYRRERRRILRGARNNKINPVIKSV